MLKGTEKIALRLPRTKSRKDKILEKEKKKKNLITKSINKHETPFLWYANMEYFLQSLLFYSYIFLFLFVRMELTEIPNPVKRTDSVPHGSQGWHIT